MEDVHPKWYIIEADNRNKIFWNMFTNLFYIISFFTFPYCIGFNFAPMSSMQPFEFVLDILLLCDIITEFITIKEKDGKKYNTVKQITFLYMKSTFVFDIASCMPGLITLEMNPKWYMFKIFRYLQMPRCNEQLEQIVKKVK